MDLLSRIFVFDKQRSNGCVCDTSMTAHKMYQLKHTDDIDKKHPNKKVVSSESSVVYKFVLIIKNSTSDKHMIFFIFLISHICTM